MADIDAICKGLAANLFALKAAGTVGHVSAYFQENAQSPSLHVIGLDAFDYDGAFGDGTGEPLTLVVEAVIGRATDIGAQKKFRALFAAFQAAAESDTRLTSRLEDNGRVTTGQAAACSDLRVSRYRGQRPLVVNGAETLVAAWSVTVLT